MPGEAAQQPALLLPLQQALCPCLLEVIPAGPRCCTGHRAPPAATAATAAAAAEVGLEIAKVVDKEHPAALAAAQAPVWHWDEIAAAALIVSAVPPIAVVVAPSLQASIASGTLLSTPAELLLCCGIVGVQQQPLLWPAA